MISRWLVTGRPSSLVVRHWTHDWEVVGSNLGLDSLFSIMWMTQHHETISVTTLLVRWCQYNYLFGLNVLPHIVYMRTLMWPAISISLIVERDVKPEGHVSFLPHTRSRHPMIVEFLDQHLSLSWHCGLWFGFSPKRVFSKIVFSATFLFLFFLHHNCGRRYMITLVWLWLCLSVYLCLYACRLCLGCLVIKIWKCSWPIFKQFG